MAPASRCGCRWRPCGCPSGIAHSFSNFDEAAPQRQGVERLWGCLEREDSRQSRCNRSSRASRAGQPQSDAGGRGVEHAANASTAAALTCSLLQRGVPPPAAHRPAHPHTRHLQAAHRQHPLPRPACWWLTARYRRAAASRSAAHGRQGWHAPPGASRLQALALPGRQAGSKLSSGQHVGEVACCPTSSPANPPAMRSVYLWRHVVQGSYSGHGLLPAIAVASQEAHATPSTGNVSTAHHQTLHTPDPALITSALLAVFLHLVRKGRHCRCPSPHPVPHQPPPSPHLVVSMASPKSPTLISPSPLSMMFSGLMSRCSTPCSAVHAVW